MKKNIIIRILSITSLVFLLFAFVQKTQHEALVIKVREAEAMTNMCRAEAEQQKFLAEEALKRALESAERAEAMAKEATKKN